MPDPTANPITAMLSGGDRRSTGRSAEAAAFIQADPAAAAWAVAGLRSADPVVRMRCADALEKATDSRPEILAPYKSVLLEEIALHTQQEVRWHVAQLLPRLELSPAERQAAVTVLTGYLADASRIVQTFALQSLFDLSAGDPPLRAQVLPLIEAAAGPESSPALRSRARKLLDAARQRKHR